MEIRMYRHYLLFTCASLTLSLIVSPSRTGASDALRVVAVTDRALPGLPTITRMRDSLPLVNKHGHVAFYGETSNRTALYSEGAGGGLQVVASFLQPLPSAGPGVFFTSVNLEGTDPLDGGLNFNDEGHVAFSAWINGPDFINNDEGVPQLFSDASGSLAMVAGELVEIPGSEGKIFQSVFANPVAFNNRGQTLFRGFASDASGMRDPAFDGIYLANSDGHVESVLLNQGPFPPGFEGVGVRPEDSFSGDRMMLNDRGDFVLSAIEAVGVDASRSSVILGSAGDGNLRVVAQMGSPVTSIGAGLTLASLGSRPSLGGGGDVVFSAWLSGTGVDSSNDSVLFRERPDGVSVVVREGDEFPGTDGAIRFTGFVQAPVLNDNDQLAFATGLDGLDVDASNNAAIVLERSDGDFEILVRTGAAVPGLPDGVTFSAFGSVHLNERGHLAFLAFVEGPGIAEGNRSGIFGIDEEGVIHSLVMTGQSVDVSRSGQAPELRTIDDIFISDFGHGNADGSDSGFSEAGHFAFRADFTDGSSAIIVSNLLAVPEPTAMFLVFLAIAAWAPRHSRAT